MKRYPITPEVEDVASRHVRIHTEQALANLRAALEPLERRPAWSRGPLARELREARAVVSRAHAKAQRWFTDRHGVQADLEDPALDLEGGA